MFCHAPIKKPLAYNRLYGVFRWLFTAGIFGLWRGGLLFGRILRFKKILHNLNLFIFIYFYHRAVNQSIVKIKRREIFPPSHPLSYTV